LCQLGGADVAVCCGDAGSGGSRGAGVGVPSGAGENLGGSGGDTWGVRTIVGLGGEVARVAGVAVGRCRVGYGGATVNRFGGI